MAKKTYANAPARKTSGSYLLVVRMPRTETVRVGRLGEIRFRSGYYVYCGSAKNGIEQRLARHLRKAGKRLRWHIDYLLDAPGSKIVQTRAFPGATPGECGLAAALSGFPGSTVTPPGFGSSDCRSGCRGHLVHFRKKPPLDRLFFLFCPP